MQPNTVLLAVVAIPLLSFTCGAFGQNVSSGQADFKSQCSICHSVQPGRNLNGPSLYGVVGRKAGQEPNFKYSVANKASGLTWDAPTLDRYLTAPRVAIPGTLMSYQGLRDPQKRTDLIAYLTTLHG